MPGRRLTREKRCIEPLAIVLHAQPELLPVVADLHVDVRRFGVPEGIAECLDRDLVDVVAENRMERIRFAFHGDVKHRRRTVAGGGGELRSERCDRVLDVARRYRRLA